METVRDLVWIFGLIFLVANSIGSLMQLQIGWRMSKQQKAAIQQTAKVAAAASLKIKEAKKA